MKDRLGKLLMAWRIRAVLPCISGDLLDVGCGTNQLVASYGVGVGVDVYPWDNVDLVVDDTARLPFEDERFDTVTIVAALNHIPNRDDVLEEAHRVLRPGGRIVITMIPPGISSVWHFLRRPWDHDQNERGMDEEEVYGFTQIQVRRLLEQAGFAIARRKRFMLGVNTVTVGVKDRAARAAA